MTVDKPVWRLIPLFEAAGRVQMAIDLWLLEQHRQGLHPPTLRFYTWSPPAISLGYHQRQWPEFWQHLTWQGQPIELVRRPTGGRAVLHQGDLTYAVITSGLSGSRTQVYQQLCEFLIAGWRSLGVELHYGLAGRGYIHNPNCFGTATAADLVLADNSKLIGSAQLYRGNAILQHGSIRLHPDRTLFAQVFETAVPPPIDIPIIQRAEAPIQIVVEELIAAAERCFQVEFQMQPLSELEFHAILAQPILEVFPLDPSASSLP
ncbi:lipoate--protein ligase family protein [Planktothrix sp. FACHB-1355]|uniref:Lipoate--protein ligase family protein n=1 Tax=Aerosakkonema funiforme FACHB-1375 TaxID=2949571 RepID=A0A926VJN1_9CYAN|nr:MULTISPECIES: biotin/lipoate A/B protein ligase family protein [Oscillatoriales]MBD2185140.1 lipoate--protein ligase family protein [Aerosakkonema funiforme FACHB-1375]MBD3558141.1 lipoate--protein ligase family protein [Planktothrix sp. FACHB-1355]